MSPTGTLAVSPLADRRLQLLAMPAAALVVAYAAAASLGAPSTALNLILTAAVAVLAPLAWGAFAKAPPALAPCAAFSRPPRPAGSWEPSSGTTTSSPAGRTRRRPSDRGTPSSLQRSRLRLQGSWSECGRSSHCDTQRSTRRSSSLRASPSGRSGTAWRTTDRRAPARARGGLDRDRHRAAPLAEANDELARANVEIRAVHTGLENLLVIADERTHGALRELIEEAGEDLAAFLRRYRAR